MTGEIRSTENLCMAIGLASAENVLRTIRAAWYSHRSKKTNFESGERTFHLYDAKHLPDTIRPSPIPVLRKPFDIHHAVRLYTDYQLYNIHILGEMATVAACVMAKRRNHHDPRVFYEWAYITSVLFAHDKSVKAPNVERLHNELTFMVLNEVEEKNVSDELTDFERQYGRYYEMYNVALEVLDGEDPNKIIKKYSRRKKLLRAGYKAWLLVWLASLVNSFVRIVL